MFNKAFFFLCVLASYSINAQIKNSENLVREMHKKYAGNFNANITFIQLNQDFDSTGKGGKHNMSFEAFHYPGKFRNDFGVTPGKDGYIITNDTMYIFENGKFKSKKYCIFDVGLLTGDIYFMRVDDAIEKLKKLNYNLTEFREDIWKERPVYVVGAKKGDEKSPQFWIDKQELYVVRNIAISAEDGQLEDQHYCEHAKVESAWVEERVEIFMNGKKAKKEHYAEVKANNELDLNIFNPRLFTKLHWRNK